MVGDPLELVEEPALLLGEELGADLVPVVELQQLALPLLELQQCRRRVPSGAGAPRRSGSPCAVEVPAYGVLQGVIVSDQAQPEQRRFRQSTGRTSRLV